MVSSFLWVWLIVQKTRLTCLEIKYRFARDTRVFTASAVNLNVSKIDSKIDALDCPHNLFNLSSPTFEFPFLFKLNLFPDVMKEKVISIPNLGRFFS